jgi:hypothetical protein
MGFENNGNEDKNRAYRDNSYLKNMEFVPLSKEPYPQYLDIPIRIEKNGNIVGIGNYRGFDKRTSKLVLQPCGVRINTHFIRRENERSLPLSFNKKENMPAPIDPLGADITPMDKEDFEYFYS